MPPDLEKAIPTRVKCRQAASIVGETERERRDVAWALKK